MSYLTDPIYYCLWTEQRTDWRSRVTKTTHCAGPFTFDKAQDYAVDLPDDVLDVSISLHPKKPATTDS